jgi:two-component system nitrate/nitrite response regulator NarL
VIVGSQPLYRESLARVLAEEPRVELVGAFADGVSALPTIARLGPSLVVADLEIADRDGLALLSALAAAGDHMRVLVISAYTDAAHAVPALRAGASGYISKDADASEIVEAVVAVARGRTVLGPRVQAEIAASMRNGAPEPHELTERERAVLALCADGLSRAEIGSHLHISPATVKAHLAQVYGKLGVSGQPAAVALAIRRGIV